MRLGPDRCPYCLAEKRGLSHNDRNGAGTYQHPDECWDAFERITQTPQQLAYLAWGSRWKNRSKKHKAIEHIKTIVARGTPYPRAVEQTSRKFGLTENTVRYYAPRKRISKERECTG